MKEKQIFVFTLFAAALAALSLAACGGILEAPAAADGGVSGGKGRVIVSIAGGLSPAEAARNAAPAPRTLLPEWEGLTYKLEFIRQGGTVPALTQTVTVTTVEQDLDPGVVYTLKVTAYKTDPAIPAAKGGVSGITVQADQSVPVTVSLTLNKANTGTLDYTVTLPPGMTLAEGSLTLYPLSGNADAASIDLSGGSNPLTASGVKTIPSGYYRLQFFVYAATGSAIKHAAKTEVVHINDSLVTKASYILAADDFSDPYSAGNPTDLTDMLNSIKAASGTVFTILITGDFSSPPVSLADTEYSGKTITLRSAPGEGFREISLASQGSLFTIGAASSEPVFVLRDITLKGMAGNSAALLKVDNGALIMESGAVVSGNTNSSNGGGVYVMGGTFTMRDGAVISGNTASYGGGVYVADGGTLVKSGGIIYGSGETGIGGDDRPLKNTARIFGFAISKGETRHRDATADPNLIFTTGVDSGQWYYELYTAGNQTELTNTLNSVKAASGIAFTILITEDFSSPPVSLADAGYNGKTITLRGTDGGREISLASQGSLFTIGAASSEPVFVLRDITLKGMAGNSAALLKVDNGALIMESGAVVTGNTNSANGYDSSYGGGVYVAGGSFTMRDNASVSGNTASGSSYTYASAQGGGVYVAGGSFTMRDNASVSGNTASSGRVSGAGVYVTGGGFIMQDSASVSGNTASASSDAYACSNGGGVCVGDDGSFTMQGDASVSGNTASSYTSTSSSDSQSMSNGGGVHIGKGTFAMIGGEIGGNSSSASARSSYSYSYGGGVYVARGGALTKTGGVIYGSNETGIGPGGYALRNTSQGSGAAVYYDVSSKKYRNTTVGAGQNLSTGNTANWID